MHTTELRQRHEHDRELLRDAALRHLTGLEADIDRLRTLLTEGREAEVDLLTRVVQANSFIARHNSSVQKLRLLTEVEEASSQPPSIRTAILESLAAGPLPESELRRVAVRLVDPNFDNSNSDARLRLWEWFNFGVGQMQTSGEITITADRVIQLAVR